MSTMCFAWVIVKTVFPIFVLLGSQQNISIGIGSGELDAGQQKNIRDTKRKSIRPINLVICGTFEN